MSNGRLRVLVPRESEGGKTYFTKIGMAFPTKNGDGFSILLDALPIGNKLVLLPDDDQRQQGGSRNQSQGGGKRGYPDKDYANMKNNDDDTVPF